MISVERSMPPPESLATTNSCNGDDVRERLLQDFFGKCYLCERVIRDGWDVEHRLPQAEQGRYADRRLDWTNLYPADGCNQCRLKWNDTREDEVTPYPVGGVLDPTDSSYDIDDRMEQRLADPAPPSAHDLRVHFGAIDPKDRAAQNTAVELRHLHGSATQNARLLRTQIYNRWSRIQACLLQVASAELEGESLAEPVSVLRMLLRRDQPFSAVMRGTLRAHHPRFLPYLD